MMKRVCLILILGLLAFHCGCMQDIRRERKEQPHLYWKDIDVVVERVDRKHWFAGTHRYEVRVAVRSDEYNLSYTGVITAFGMFRPKQWSYRKGDIVKAELYTWVLDSTGEVIRREINRVY